MSAALLLSACDGGEEPTDPPTTETSSSTTPTQTESESTETADVPTPPEVEAPTPAPEAAVDDHVGAIWAVRYFLDLYPYMRSTGDTAPFEAMSAPECDFCTSSIENATEIHDAGGWVDGGEITFDISEATAEYPAGDEQNYTVRFTMTQAAQTLYNLDGSSESTEAGNYRVAVALRQVDGRFMVFGVNYE